MIKHEGTESTPFRVSITGIDGVGKDTVARLALAQAASDGLNVVKMGRPTYTMRADSTTSQLFARTTGAFDKAHQGADAIRSRFGISALNVLSYVTQARLLEPIVARREPTPDIITWVRDPRIDPAVYFSYYAPRSLNSRVTVAERLRAMQRLTGSHRDIVVVLNIDPDIAMERIEQRLAIEQGKAANSYRGKWQHMHENPDTLADLAMGYAPVLTALQDIAPTRIVEIDTTNRSQETVAGLAYTTIKNAMNGSIGSPAHFTI